MIDGRTQLVGLIGWPVEHSLSPVMHNAAFQALGLPWCYVPLPVPPGKVEAAVRGIAALGFRGVNVTIPHKRAVIPVLDRLAPDAAALGAVNTVAVAREDGGQVTLIGHNTDAEGFIRALRRAGRDPTGVRAVILGAGGAARAAVFALRRAGAAEVVVLNRTLSVAQALVADLEAVPLPDGGTPGGRLVALSLTPETVVESARAADLLVNATPLGMWPDVQSSPWPDGVPVPSHLTVYDLVYNPPQTRLLEQARRSGAQAVGGLGMLVEQGALALEIWTGKPAPVEVMTRAYQRALRRYRCSGS